MNELIKIEKSNVGGDLIETVNARELHSFLEVGKDFSTWIKNRIEQYGFVDGVDFVSMEAAPQNGGAQTLLVEDLNQLGRRNLTRDQRDALIKRLAASGVRQKDIAEKVGLTRQAVTHIVREANNLPERPVNTTTAAQELQAKQDEIEALRRLAEAGCRSRR